MPRVDPDFKDKVHAMVAQIPKGRLMTYGQIAGLCGAPWAAWEVGQIAHTGPIDLPWQRVVNKKGGLAPGYPGGVVGHQRHLEAEGITVSDDVTVDIKALQWTPGP